RGWCIKSLSSSSIFTYSFQRENAQRRAAVIRAGLAEEGEQVDFQLVFPLHPFFGTIAEIFLPFLRSFLFKLHFLL
ncbi:MAG: hypothetical protein ACOX50_04000, partial [Patescibacteria group bacterium]